MLNTIKPLKQQNEAAFNFALAGIITFCLAIIGLAYLFNDVMEQKQIAKQVGDLQMIENRIQTIISSNKLGHGETVAFLEFENNVNIFNKQWFEFKGKYHYSTKTIKEVDEVWQRVNGNAKKIVLKKKEMMTLREAVHQINISFYPMHKMNEELVNLLLNHKINSEQVVIAKNLNVLLLRKESDIKSIFYPDENAVISEDNFGNRDLEEIEMVLNGFLSGDQLDVRKVEDIKAREIIQNEIVLCKKMMSIEDTILNMQSIFFEVREAHAAIYRDSPQLKSALSKLNNHQLNKGLIVFVICIWLVFFACVFGFLRALTSSEEFL